MQVNISAKTLFSELITKGLTSSGSYRAFLLELPTETDFDELKNYLQGNRSRINSWELIKSEIADKLPYLNNGDILEFHRSLFDQIASQELENIDTMSSRDLATSKDRKLSFYIKRSGFLDTNFGKVLTIIFLEFKQRKILLIYSYFEIPQPIERGKLTAVNEKVVEAVKGFYKLKGINIEKYLVEMQKYQDTVGKYDFKLNPAIVIVLLIVLIPITLVFVYLFYFGIYSFRG